MGLKINEIDFLGFNLDKYITYLKKVYFDLRFEIREIPFYQRELNRLLVLKYKLETHYKIHKETNLPEKIKSIIDNKINYQQSKLDDLKKHIPLLIGFNSIEVKIEDESKKYLFFSEAEIEKVEINIDSFLTWEHIYNKNLTDFENEINEGFSTTPLTKKDFHKNLQSNLKNKEFKFLDFITSGSFIDNLDVSDRCSEFFMECIYLQQISYLEHLINSNKSINKKQNSLNSELNANQIEKIYNSFAPFVKSELKQWFELFSPNVNMSTPIELKTGFSIVDLAYFFKELRKNELIKNDNWASVLEKGFCFISNSKKVTAKNISKGKQNLKARQYKVENDDIAELLIELTEKSLF